MTWQVALDLVVARTGHGRYRWLCSEANPDAETRDGYRALMLRMAGEPVPEPSPEDVALREYVARHGGCCH